jgi:hypothetical protein
LSSKNWGSLPTQPTDRKNTYSKRKKTPETPKMLCWRRRVCVPHFSIFVVNSKLSAIFLSTQRFDHPSEQQLDFNEKLRLIMQNLVMVLATRILSVSLKDLRESTRTFQNKILLTSEPQTWVNMGQPY